VKATFFSGTLNASSLPCGKSATSFLNLSVGEHGTLSFFQGGHFYSCHCCHISFLDHLEPKLCTHEVQHGSVDEHFLVIYALIYFVFAPPSILFKTMVRLTPPPPQQEKIMRYQCIEFISLTFVLTST
jgi:hypothetical protein